MSVRTGLVGAGRMGTVLARLLTAEVPQAKLVAIADVRGERAEALAQECDAEAAYSTPEELLARDDIEAVLLVTPSHTHPELVEAAALTGKHIFIEKPLALTIEGCDRAIAAAQAARVKIQVGFMRRFDSAYLAAREAIEAGAIGRPVMFKSVNRDPTRTSLEFARRESSGGLIMDLGAHDFDTARWLMGSEVVRVQSEGSTLAYPELSEVGDIDNAVVNLLFADGAVGNVDLSRNAVYGYDRRTEVLGTEGAVVIRGLGGAGVKVLTAQKPVQHEREGPFREGYIEELRHFVDCVAHDLPPRATSADARQATGIAVAATRSLDEGRAVRLDDLRPIEPAQAPGSPQALTGGRSLE